MNLISNNYLKKLFSEFWLLIFFVFLFLLYIDISYFVFFFMLPLFFYLDRVYRISFLYVFFLICIFSSFMFFHFSGYGFEFFLIIILANLLFFLPFMYASFYFLKRGDFLFMIPVFFYLLIFLFSLSPFENFWLFYVSYLPYLPLSISYLGSFYISSLLVFFNLILYLIFFRENIIRLGFREFFLKKKVYIFILFLILPILFIPISSLDDSEFDKKILVLGIQGNVDKSWEERYFNPDSSESVYLSLSNLALEMKPEIIIWPEYVFTHPLEFDYSRLDRFLEFSNENNLTLILGSILLEDRESYISKRYNSLYIFGSGGIFNYNAIEPIMLFDSEVLRADKIEVPSFEDFEEVGFSLCFEENFPYIFREQVSDFDVGFFLSSGNQYYISSDLGLRMSSHNARLRAAENRRYVFRILTSGLSMVIDHRGEVLDFLPMHERGILTYDIPVVNTKSFYSLYGGRIEIIGFFIAILLVLLQLLILGRRLR